MSIDRSIEGSSHAAVSARNAGAESAAENLMTILGLDVTSEGMKDTPERFVRYLKEFIQPFKIEEVLGDGFESPGASGVVVQAKIPFRMVCEHHLLPALGRTAIGYIPNKRVVGLSKLTRLVQAVGTEAPGLQEGITDRICLLLHKHIEAHGTIVVIEAEHSCMAARGVASPGVPTITSSVRGAFRDVPAARQEFFSLISQVK